MRTITDYYMLKYLAAFTPKFYKEYPNSLRKGCLPIYVFPIYVHQGYLRLFKFSNK